MTTGPTALTAEYRKVITARYLDKPCYTCGGKLAEGDYAATNTYSAWYSYCAKCASSFAAQVSALLARIEDKVAPLGDNVPANITAEVDKVTKYVEAVLNGSTDIVTVQSAKSGLLIILGLVEAAVAKPDPLIEALTTIAAGNDRDANFARSLLQGHAKYGSLTTNQRNAAQSMIDRHLLKATAAQRQAQANVPFNVPDVGLYRSDDGTVRRVYKTNRSRFASRRYNGTQFVYEGTPGLRLVADGLAAGTTRLLNAVEASAFGKQIGRCFNCMSIGRPGHLSDDRSLSVGYGEICAGHNGWWYPNADEAARILRGDLDLDAKLTQSLTAGTTLPAAPTADEASEVIEALESGVTLDQLDAPLDAADEYLDDECPQCGRVLGTSNGISVCDNCGWGYNDTSIVTTEDDDEAPVIVTEDTVVNERDLYDYEAQSDTVASSLSEAPVSPVEARTCASCGNEPATLSYVCQDGEAHKVCPPCRVLLVRRPVCPFHGE